MGVGTLGGNNLTAMKILGCVGRGLTCYISSSKGVLLTADKPGALPIPGEKRKSLKKHLVRCTGGRGAPGRELAERRKYEVIKY